MRRGGLPALALFLQVTAVRGAALPTLDYVAPEDCPARDRVEALLRQQLRGAGDASSAKLFMHLVRQGPRHRGELRLTLGKAEERRVIEAEQCATVVEALVLSAALALEAQQRANPTPSPSLPTPAPEPSASASAPETAPEAGTEGARFGIEGEAGLGTPLPDALMLSGALRLFLEFPLGGLRPVLRAGANYGAESPLASLRPVATWLVGGNLDLGLAFRLDRLELTPALRVRGSAITATETIGARRGSATRPLLSLGPVVRMGLRLPWGISPYVEGGLGLAVPERRFRVEGPGGGARATTLLVPEIALGISFRFGHDQSPADWE